MGVLGHGAAVAVRGDLSLVAAAPHVLDVVAYGQHQLVRHQPRAHQVQGELVRHLPHHQPRLVIAVGALEDLPGPDALGVRLVRLDLCHRAGLPAPGVVDEELRVHPEEPVEEVLVRQGAPGDIAHGVQPVGLQLLGVPTAHPPKIREGTVVPQVAAVALLVQLGDAHAVRVRLGVLGPDVHGDLAEVEVGTDARRGGDARGLQHVQNDPLGQLPGREPVGVQVVGHVHQHLVD